MTYRATRGGRAARRRAHKEAEFRATVEEEVRRRPPRAEEKIVPAAVGRSFGPPSAFEVGATIRTLSDYACRGERAYVHTLGPPPRERSVVVAIQGSLRNYRIPSGEDLEFTADTQMRLAQFDAVRMRAKITTTDGTTNYIDWWTWEPRQGRAAYGAVRQARAYLDYAIQRLRSFPIEVGSAHWENNDNVVTLRKKVDDNRMTIHNLLIRTQEIREWLTPVMSAADEWLASPEPDSKPNNEVRV